MPPSLVYMCFIVWPMPGSFFLIASSVTLAPAEPFVADTAACDACEACGGIVVFAAEVAEDADGAATAGSCFASAAKDADWIDRRVRTMSRGYVTVTEVMPANAPQTRRSTAERGAPGVVSKPCLIDQSDSHTMRSLLSIQYWSLDIHQWLVSCLGCSCIQRAPGVRRSLLCCCERSCPLCCCCSALLLLCLAAALLRRHPHHTQKKTVNQTYLLIDIVTPKLHRRIGHNAYTIRAIARHHTSPTLLPPHLAQRLGNAHLILIAAHILHLEQDLEALERTDDGAGDGARDAAGDEGRDDRL